MQKVWAALQEEGAAEEDASNSGTFWNVTRGRLPIEDDFGGLEGR